MAARSSVTAAVSKASAPVGTMAALCDQLNVSFAERKSVIRAIARAFLAGEHVFILGEPGTGKSLLIRCFAQALGLSYWEYLMTRFTTPEEVFGPLSIKGLQNDRYTRATRGSYLPGAEVAFLDEIWKSNSGILNALLTITNERVFHDDGKPTNVPLVSLAGASNELPESESELAALYDRFLVRVVTQYVGDRDAFQAMVFNPTPVAPTVKIDLKAEQAKVRAVMLPADVQTALVDLRYKVRDAGFKVSDRRWRQCVSLVRATAHLEGRDVAEPEDLECLEDVLWRTPDERTNVARIIQETVNPAGAQAVRDLDSAKELRATLPVIDPKNPDSKTKFLSRISSVNQDLKDIATRLEGLPSTRKVVSARAEVAEIRKETSKLAARAAGIDL
jgi:MoxR-like ATPase